MRLNNSCYYNVLMPLNYLALIIPTKFIIIQIYTTIYLHRIISYIKFVKKYIDIHIYLF